MKTGFAAAAALCATAANALMYSDDDVLKRDGECYRNEWVKCFNPDPEQIYDYYYDYMYVPKYQGYCLDE